MLKGDGQDQFHSDVPSHVVHTRSTSNLIGIGIFQPTQMILVGTVKQVVDKEEHRGSLTTFPEDVGAGIYIK